MNRPALISVFSDQRRTKSTTWNPPEYLASLPVHLFVQQRTVLCPEGNPAPRHRGIISQLTADSFFPNEDPIGKHLVVDLGLDDHPRPYEIVGVVGDTRYLISVPPQPTMYFSMASGLNGRAVIVVRSQHDVTSLAIPVQQVVNRWTKTYRLPTCSL